MLGEILRFEIRYRLRQPIFYLFAALFLLMGFGPVATDSVQVGGAIGKVARNAPFVTMNILGSLGAIGLIVITIFVTSAVNRDHQRKIQELFFSTPLRSHAYIFGRFLGSIIPTVVAIAFGALGMFLATIMPWQDPQHILPFSALPYLNAFVILVIPNLFFAGALFFSVTTLTRRVIWGWISVIGFFSLWGFAQSFIRDLENVKMAAMVDPLGLTALHVATRYWTVVEKNTLLIELSGVMLYNRLLWMSCGILILLYTWRRYRMALPSTSPGGRQGQPHMGTKERDGKATLKAPRRQVSKCYNIHARMAQWRHLAWMELRDMLRGVPFIVIVLLGIMNLSANMVAGLDGTTGFPVTRRMLQFIEGGYDLMLFLVVVIYGGYLIWKERRAGMAELIDSLPVPNGVFLSAKLVALWGLTAAALLVAMLTTITFQLIKGYPVLELDLYLKGLFLVSLSYWMTVGILALTVHVLVNNRNLGFLLMVLYFLAMDLLPEFGLEHRLYYFAKTPRVTYSDMNGYGHFQPAMIWFKTYWGFCALGLILLADLLWSRGTDLRLRFRMREAWRRLFSRETRFQRIGLTASLVGFLCTGCWIYYNTNILNDFQTRSGGKEVSACYEKRFKDYENAPQPTTVDVNLEVDIFPESRRVDLRGRMLAENKTSEPVTQLLISLNRDLMINRLDLPSHEIIIDDRDLGFRICDLDQPIAPGDTMAVTFELSVQPRGFVNSGSNTRIVENGTFFDNGHYLPRFGYDRARELEHPQDRRRHDLPPRPRCHPVNDMTARMRTDLGIDSGWITYEAVISTAPDQIAITPGYLQREWTENNRRYFHYRMDAPILNFYSILSGKFAVHRDHWNDVSIEIYYHEDHVFNVERMVESIQQSLDYFTSNFGPYQFRQVRIIEFPGYRTFAQSFPNTIPYSEKAHFIEDLRDSDNIDMVFYITAHEVAHQWWGHQVTGGNVQGSQMLTESLAQYSALMVMEQEYGPEHIEKFLAYELNRYLRGRGNERTGEQPLALVESQPYLYYSKGSLALYALRDYIGEETINKVLCRFVDEKAYQEPPYTTSLELLEYLREVTPEDFLYLIDDLFEHITLYSNRAMKAEMVPTEDGRYMVRLEVQSQKLRSDPQGVETEIAHEDLIEIGIFGTDEHGDPEQLYLAKHLIGSGTTEVEIVVEKRPVRAGIDPRHLLIDRVPEDNTIKVS